MRNIAASLVSTLIREHQSSILIGIAHLFNQLVDLCVSLPALSLSCTAPHLNPIASLRRPCKTTSACSKSTHILSTSSLKRLPTTTPSLICGPCTRSGLSSPANGSQTTSAQMSMWRKWPRPLTSTICMLCRLTRFVFALIIMTAQRMIPTTPPPRNSPFAVVLSYEPTAPCFDTHKQHVELSASLCSTYSRTG